MRVHAKPDPRFRRSKRPAWRGRGLARRSLRLAVTLLLLAGVPAAGYEVVTRLRGASFLTVSTISVEGNDRVSDDEVRALLAGVAGANILALDLDRERDRLLASPWLRDGTLRRVLPGRLEVTVRERRPLALARFDTRLFLVDAGGVVIDRYGPRFADLELPIIDGLAGAAGAAPAVEPDRMALADRVITQLSRRPEVLSAVSQIDVSDPYDAVVLLEEDAALLHLGDDRFLERLRSYAELAPALRERVGEIDYVDLRFEPRVYVGPAGKTPPAASGRNHLAVAPAPPAAP